MARLTFYSDSQTEGWLSSITRVLPYAASTVLRRPSSSPDRSLPTGKCLKRVRRRLKLLGFIFHWQECWWSSIFVSSMAMRLPFLTSYDPPGTSEGTLDPLGLYQIADQLAIR